MTFIFSHLSRAHRCVDPSSNPSSTQSCFHACGRLRSRSHLGCPLGCHLKWHLGCHLKWHLNFRLASRLIKSVAAVLLLWASFAGAHAVAQELKLDEDSSDRLVSSPTVSKTSASSHRASSGSSSKLVAERLRGAIQASGFKEAELGIWVGRREAQGLQSWFQLNAEKSFIPASLSKLVTAGAVLHGLHPGHKFRTELVTDSKINQGALSGSLYLRGAGDPSFVSENMWFLVNELTRTGLTSIEGDVVVDDSHFDTVRFDDDRQDERVDRAYDAPIGAMSLNWNSVSVYVRPGEKPGDALKVHVDVASPYLKVRNQARTVAAGRGKTVSVERLSESGFQGDVIAINGAMAVGLPEAVFYKSISKPDLWAGFSLVEFLRQRGITVKGRVRVGGAPKNVVTLAVSESKPLSAIVADMSKWSNNYVSEMLVKGLAAAAGERPATMKGGMSHVRRNLELAGLKAGEYVFVNAAGLTRQNRMTPLQIGLFLEHVHSDFSLFPEYLTSLPIAGVDGTLRSRMKGTGAEKWVRAKTGLLTGVVGLAGFAGRVNGETVTFVFIYNGAGREDRARLLFDRMAASLVQD